MELESIHDSSGGSSKSKRSNSGSARSAISRDSPVRRKVHARKGFSFGNSTSLASKADPETLLINVIAGRFLPDTANTYVTVEVERESSWRRRKLFEGRTQLVPRSGDPIWAEKFKVRLEKVAGKLLTLTVYNKDLMGGGDAEALGEWKLRLDTLIFREVHGWESLRPVERGRLGEEEDGSGGMRKKKLIVKKSAARRKEGGPEEEEEQVERVAPRTRIVDGESVLEAQMKLEVRYGAAKTLSVWPQVEAMYEGEAEEVRKVKKESSKFITPPQERLDEWYAAAMDPKRRLQQSSRAAGCRLFAGVMVMVLLAVAAGVLLWVLYPIVNPQDDTTPTPVLEESEAETNGR